MKLEQVLSHVRNGQLAARLRWNKNVPEGQTQDISFIFITRNEEIQTPNALLDTGVFDANTMTLLPHQRKKNRGDKISIWTPSVEEMQAGDWYIVDFKNEWSAVCGNFNRNYNHNRDRDREETSSDDE